MTRVKYTTSTRVYTEGGVYTLMGNGDWYDESTQLPVGDYAAQELQDALDNEITEVTFEEIPLITVSFICFFSFVIVVVGLML